jgi:hypothetical protein
MCKPANEGALAIWRARLDSLVELSEWQKSISAEGVIPAKRVSSGSDSGPQF